MAISEDFTEMEEARRFYEFCISKRRRYGGPDSPDFRLHKRFGASILLLNDCMTEPECLSISKFVVYVYL